MPERTLTIFEDDIIVERIVDSSGIDIVDDGANRIIEIYTEGPRGQRGIRGETGYSGAGEPFYVVTSGSLYATTASLAILSSFSSSLIPSTGSYYDTTHDLGSINQSWRRVYVSESIFIVKSGSVLVELRGSENTLEIGQSKITTSSFGFDLPMFRRVSSTQQTMTVLSGSVSASFNLNGIFVVSEFNSLPSPVSGGIIKSGSAFFFGI